MWLYSLLSDIMYKSIIRRLLSALEPLKSLQPLPCHANQINLTIAKAYKENDDWTCRWDDRIQENLGKKSYEIY